MNNPNLKLEIGSVIEIMADNIGMNGEGVARFEGITVFCDGILPGEKAKVQISEIKKNFARAFVKQLITTSTERQTPPCPYYDLCGGCQLQHMNYASQTSWKTLEVKEQLKRVGKLEFNVNETLAAPEPFGYRNKIQLPVGKQNGTIKMGMYQRNSHDIVDIDTCLLQSPLGNRLLAAVKHWLLTNQISVYDEQKHQGLLRHVMIRTNKNDSQALLTFVVNGALFPIEVKQIQAWANQFPELKGILLNHNTKQGNTVLGEHSSVLWGSSEMIDSIGPAEFVLTDRAFFQINRQQTQALYERVAEHLRTIKPKRILDAYCGIGSIGITIAKLLQDPQLHITGVEVVEIAVIQARENAKRNALENTQYFVGRCEELLPKMVEQGLKLDCAIFDPPRQGCQPEFLHAVLKVDIPHLVYVSCNPVTLARDLVILTQAGYKVMDVQPVDMFPQTTHVETVVLMSRVRK
jgi:23S rRNA (uracil1939-C5)-methyltransferase